MAWGYLSAAKDDIILAIQQSKFTNINTYCIGLKYTIMALTSVVFNNSALEYTPSQTLDDSIDEADGVTWINFYGGNTLTGSTITSCKFIENKIPSKYGGVSCIFLVYNYLHNRL